MALKVQTGGDGKLFIGEDKIFRLFVYDRKVANVFGYNSSFHPVNESNVEVIPADENGVAANQVDLAGKTIKFVVRKKADSPDPPLIDETATIAGTFNVDPLQNTQRAEVTITDDDMAVANFPKADTYQCSWKDMTVDGETVLSYGDFVVERATQVL